jgi:hypothetical protein
VGRQHGPQGSGPERGNAPRSAEGAEMIEGTMKCYKCGKRSYDDNACLDEETGLPCWRSPTEEDGWEICKP